MKRALLAALVLAVVAAVAAGIWLVRSVDGLVARAIEEIGSELVGTRVQVASVDVDLRAGRAMVRGLSVANPPGFSQHPALALGEIAIEVDLDSVRASPLVLDEVRVLAPSVRAEALPGGVNLDVLRKNLAKATSRTGGEATPQGASGEPLRLVVREFSFEDGTLHADTSALGGDAHDLALPRVQLANLGGAKGALPAEIGEQALDAILAKAIRTAAKDRFSGDVEKQLGDVAEKAGSALRDLLGVEKK